MQAGVMLTLDIKTPFSLARSLEFMSRFPACRDAVVLAPDRVTAAIAVDGTAHAFTIRESRGKLVVELAGQPSSTVQRAVRMCAEQFVGATDDLKPFYAAAEGDRELESVIAKLHGLHHVRFLTLAEAVVYAILMQRTPMPVAATYKRRFLASLGIAVEHEGHTLRAMPELGALAALDADTIASAIGHRGKAARIATVAPSVHAIGEEFLRTAPYDAARDALLAIPGVGAFAATAILLRGLGRMDALPWMPQFARAARAVYGREVTEAAIVRRYGRHVGYWSFYVMTAAARDALH